MPCRIRTSLWNAVVVCGVLGLVSDSNAPQATAGEKPTATFEHLYDIPFQGKGMPVTMIHDAANRPYLYVAANEAGLRIYDVARQPKLVQSIPVDRLGTTGVVSLTQVGQRLYLALGNHWGKSKSAGLAVIDVATPSQAGVAGVWNDNETGGAGGAVAVKGRTAYLAAMGNGLVTLDVGDPTAIKVLSRLIPEPKFPEARFDKKKINARGLALQKNLLFLCHDAGGLRVIDVADPRKPKEIGRFSNPAMLGKPRAYNNVALHGSLAYVAVDYVGLEILDVSNPREIKLVGWWNPWNPKLQPLRWFGSPGHANEIVFDARTKTVLLSAGQTDLAAVDVSRPAEPRHVGTIGAVDDRQATWGVSMHGDVVYLSYIRTLGIPFRADWPGIKAYRYRR